MPYFPIRAFVVKCLHKLIHFTQNEKSPNKLFVRKTAEKKGEAEHSNYANPLQKTSTHPNYVPAETEKDTRRGMKVKGNSPPHTKN